jgi:glycosyltransferase involved in cell wall biosynthesis
MSAPVPSGRPDEVRRIAIVTETYTPEINGVALTLARLAQELRARGRAVSVVHPGRFGDDDTASSNDDGAMRVVGVPVPGYPQVRIGLPAGRRLRARWTVDRPDAVYVATPGPLGWSALRTARRLGLPVLSGFHTNFHRYAEHYHAGWLRHLVCRGLRRFHNSTDGTLVATTELRDELAVVGFRQLHVVGRGVDTERFAPKKRSRALRASWGATEQDLVVAYVGRVAAEKNPGLAIEAYRAMQSSGGVGPLVVVGDGPLRAGLADAHPDVVFTGAQSGPVLAAHYASADVFLFPSATETFGNVVLEAMASGLAIIAYDYAAARAHLRDGHSALLAPLGDARGFVARSAMLAPLPAFARALGRRARAAAFAADWTSVAQRFETLLLDAPTRRHAEPGDLVARGAHR